MAIAFTKNSDHSPLWNPSSQGNDIKMLMFSCLSVHRWYHSHMWNLLYMGLDTFIHTLNFSKSICFRSLEWILYYDVGIKIVSVAHTVTKLTHGEKMSWPKDYIKKAIVMHCHQFQKPGLKVNMIYCLASRTDSPAVLSNNFNQINHLCSVCYKMLSQWHQVNSLMH